jgi:hypothetical protein
VRPGPVNPIQSRSNYNPLLNTTPFNQIAGPSIAARIGKAARRQNIACNRNFVAVRALQTWQSSCEAVLGVADFEGPEKERFWTMRQGYLAHGEEVVHNITLSC